MRGNMKSCKNLIYNSKACKLDVYLPDFSGFKTILYFHGGGIEEGDKADPNVIEIGKRFVSLGYGFVSVNYRMYPKARFPDFLRDCAEATAYAQAHCKEWGGNVKLIVSGQSAGAWMALMLCMDTQWLREAGVDSNMIAEWLIDSAQTTSHFNVIKYERGENPNLQRIDGFSPQYFVGPETKFSRMLLIFYEKDMPCRPEQNRLFEKSIRLFNPSADVTCVQLTGEHCHGSTTKESDGEYAFVKAAIRWLDGRKI